MKITLNFEIIKTMKAKNKKTSIISWRITNAYKSIKSKRPLFKCSNKKKNKREKTKTNFYNSNTQMVS